MTGEELEAIKNRLAAAQKCDPWGHDGRKLTFTPERRGRNAAVWYGDGDQCAEVHGNLGLGIDGDAVAEFFAHSMADIEGLIAEIESLKK